MTTVEDDAAVAADRSMVAARVVDLTKVYGVG